MVLFIIYENTFITINYTNNTIGLINYEKLKSHPKLLLNAALTDNKLI